MGYQPERQAEWDDTAQICCKGHLVAAFAYSKPDLKRNFCEECGAETIDACPTCGKAIRGYHHIPGLKEAAGLPVPPFCVECGKPFPWNADIKEIHRSPLSQGLVMGTKIFISHGRSPVWLQLKDFLFSRLHLACDEFNEESTAGLATIAWLEQMLDAAQFAFLVMTAEDMHEDATAHARENVIHEAGLFQGRLGFKRAIILLEQGCVEFSNIHGLTTIRFPKGNIKPAYEEIRQVLKREGILGMDLSRSD